MLVEAKWRNVKGAGGLEIQMPVTAPVCSYQTPPTPLVP